MHPKINPNWKVEHTGGGCTWLALYAGGYHVAITEDGTAEAPDGDTTCVNIGVYGPEHSESLLGSNLSQREKWANNAVTMVWRPVGARDPLVMQVAEWLLRAVPRPHGLPEHHPRDPRPQGADLECVSCGRTLDPIRGCCSTEATWSDPDAPRRLADAFRSEMMVSQGPATCRQIDWENARREALGDTQSCASHDFCDANMVLEAAWSAVFDEGMFDIPPGMAETDENQERVTAAHTPICNKAWEIVRTEGFFSGWGSVIRAVERDRAALEAVLEASKVQVLYGTQCVLADDSKPHAYIDVDTGVDAFQVLHVEHGVGTVLHDINCWHALIGNWDMRFDDPHTAILASLHIAGYPKPTSAYDALKTYADERRGA